ncbi:hypothetical protein P4233_11005 [Pseudomonas aeruginosa]|nr:hypothetical protein [Pseudomonas aeruginosa]
MSPLRKKQLSSLISEIGFGAVTREDEAYLVGRRCASRWGVPDAQIKPMIEGEVIRDWALRDPSFGIWPYSEETLMAQGPRKTIGFLWPMRKNLSGRVAYGLSQLERGLEWYEYSMFFHKRYKIPLSITFAFVSTHNHFVLDRGGKVFKQSAPVMKLPKSASEADHFSLLGLLNSSIACFWMKQVFHNKGDSTDSKGARVTGDPAFDNEFTGTGLKNFPVAADPAKTSQKVRNSWMHWRSN